MSFGVGTRAAIALGLGGLISFFSGYASDNSQNNLEQENGFNLLQENSSLILLE
jgi:hypothetical protein